MVVNSFFTYAGVEVNAVHVNELKNPAREYPRSISWPWRWSWPSSSARRWPSPG
jgi:amino acid permease